MIAGVVYLLCALTSLTCAVLLLRSYRQTRVRLLFWSGWCFVGLAVNNALLFVDLRVVTEKDLFLLRSAPALLGVLLLIYGLITDGE